MAEPRYKINPLTGELESYYFDYNGIVALKNFKSRIDGERLIIHAADDVNFSILEALVSEVEIDGALYDNPEAAQEALMQLTFNQNRPVVISSEERLLIHSALQKGGYNGTAQDLKNAIDLINTVLQSDDSTLDELQEIVNYIKMNKSDLQNLSIDNIAGLSEALHKLNNQNYVLKTSANINTSQPINNISQNGRNVVTIGSSNIVVTVDSIDGFMATYQKGGTGNITFQAGTGKTLIQVDGTNIVNGSIGSTATITVVGNEILLRISNA